MTTAGEFLKPIMWLIIRSTPDARPGQPRTKKRKCGIQPAHQSLLTDVFASRLLLCTIHQCKNFTMNPRGDGKPCVVCLTGDIRMEWSGRAPAPPAGEALARGANSGEIEALARQDQACSRLMTVPGIGPIISSAMVAAIGTGDVFSKGRNFGAWLGLVPKQISTGDRTILGKISRRGNRYLRVLFVQAAWVVLVRIKNWERYGLKSWIEAAKRRLHHNVLAIALANKLARIAWAVLAKGRAFELTRTDDAGVRPA